MSNLKNFFFDLDGVLVDACHWHFEALNYALQHSCGFEITYEQHLEKYNGLPTKKKLSMLGIKEELFTEIIQSKNEQFDNIVEEKCSEDQDKIEIMAVLKKNNCKISCVSNSIRHTVVSVLSKLGIYDYFDLIVSNQDVVKNKPDPYPYDYAIAQLGCDPKLSIIVEDSPVGIMSACQSKAAVVWKIDNAKELCLQNLNKIIGG